MAGHGSWSKTQQAALDRAARAVAVERVVMGRLSSVGEEALFN